MSFTLIGKHEKDSRANRDGYVTALEEMMQADRNVVHIDCDLYNCINTAKLEKEFPGQCFNAGIAEADAMGIAAGMTADNIDVVSLRLFQRAFYHLVGYCIGKQHEQIRLSHLFFQVSRHLGKDLRLTFICLADVMVLADHSVVSTDNHNTHKRLSSLSHGS